MEAIRKADFHVAIDCVNSVGGIIFQNCPKTAPVARYHSLAADTTTMPSCLKVTAVTEDGEIMAVQHKDYPIYGVQFHHGSIMTPNGKTMLENFLKEN